MTTEMNQSQCYDLKPYMMGGQDQVQVLHDAHQC